MKLYNLVRSFIEKRNFKKLKFQKIGDNVYFASGWNVICPNEIEMDEDIYLGPDANLYGHGGIVIKSGVICGPKLTIYSANHNFRGDIESIPYDSVLLRKQVIINENVWIGGNVIILPGVQIGEGSIIAAGSVVTKNVEKYKIVGGNPAKVVGERDEQQYLKLKSADKIYLKIKNGKHKI